MKFFSSIFLAASLAFAPFTFQQKDGEDTVSKSFKAQKGGLLEVDVEPGNVRVEPWNKDEVLVQAENIDDRHPERLEITQSGNAVKVKYKDRRRNVHGLRFIISVPSQFNADIKTTGGNVQEIDQLTGSFKVDTRGGNVDVDEIVGKVEVESGGGNITGQKIQGDMQVRTGGGNVVVKVVTRTMTVSSGGGNMKIESVGKDLNLDTGGGSVTVGDVGGEARIGSGGGNMKVGKVATQLTLTTGGGNVEVKGASGTIYVKSGGGNVLMEGITGAVDLRTGGGTVKVELIPSGKGNSTLTSGGGDVRLSLPENSKVTVEASLRIKHGWGGRRKKYDIISDFKSDKYEKDEDREEIYARYTLNGGGETITVETTNGNIEIRKINR